MQEKNLQLNRVGIQNKNNIFKLNKRKKNLKLYCKIKRKVLIETTQDLRKKGEM